MNKTSLLVVSTDNDVTNSILQKINAISQWNGHGAATVEEAIEKFHYLPADVVVLAGNGIKEEEKKLRVIFNHQHPRVIFISLPDDEHDSAVNKIEGAIAEEQKSNKPAFTFVDDVLKNAGLNISIQ